MAFFIEVITTPRNDPDTIHDRRRINYDNSRSRKWLANHSNWALRNGFAVHTAAAPGWVSVNDARTRPHHTPQVEIPTMQPRDLGRFNCRGDYVFRDDKLSDQ